MDIHIDPPTVPHGLHGFLHSRHFNFKMLIASLVKLSLKFEILNIESRDIL